MSKVLIIGNGGREHALAWKLAQSSKVSKIFIASGNGGTSEIGENISVKPVSIFDIKSLCSLRAFAAKNHIDLTVVGSEELLAAGIVDVFKKYDLPIFGPSAWEARIETSKIIAKKLMNRAGIPTASFEMFNKYNDALEYVKYVKKKDFPIVIKTNGLSFGKGVYICKNKRQAKKALWGIMVDRVYQSAGNMVIIEGFIKGEEASFHALCDKKDCILFPPSRDYKSVFEDGKGLNTGGMGAIVPVTEISNEILDKVETEIIRPTLNCLKTEGTVFTGCLYPGVKITPQGLKVLEFNARFGDPETQVYMRLLKNDLFEVIKACVEDRLSDIKLEWEEGFAVCVVLTSKGYPGDYKKGYRIDGIREAEKIPGVKVFHSGTVIDNGKPYTAGGRVLAVTAMGSSLKEAVDSAYEAITRVNFKGAHYRLDIGGRI